MSFEIPMEEIVSFLGAIQGFHDGVGRYLKEMGLSPRQGSKAASEMFDFSRPELLTTAYSQATQNIDIAFDYLLAFRDVVTEPAAVYAPWTCVRGLLEAATTAAWLLDIGIDAKERVGRSFAIRYEGLVEGGRFGRASKDLSIVDFSSDRISVLQTEAKLLGYAPILNKAGKTDGLGVQIPSITSLSVGLTGDESVYRLLSGMAHSSPWAVMALANRLTGKQAVNLIDGDSRTSVQFMEKTLTTKSVGLLGVWATRWCFDVVGRQAGLFGWPATELGVALSEINRLIIGWRRFAE